MDKVQQGITGLLELILAAKDKKTSATLLQLFLTPEEKEALATRFLIVEALLKAERTQRQMAEDLNVSIAKITRGSNELKRIDKKLLQYLKENLLV